MSSISIAQQIAELKAELAHTCLTKAERAEARREIDWLVEQQRVEDEASTFAAIEREAEASEVKPFRFDDLQF